MTPLIFLIIFSFVYIHCEKNQSFVLKYKWRILNFTWPCREAYQNALKTRKYIPENGEIKGLKIYKEDMYFAIPLYKPGIPVTLATAKKDDWKNATVRPFPNWDENVDPKNCSTLQSVQGVEIDNKGILWVIDGERQRNFTDCPCKLVLFDLNRAGRRVLTHIFPDEICLSKGAFLNDIVIDETDGTYAYISDSSVIDPGLIVFSRKANKAWKIRDKSMYPDIEASDWLLNGVVMSKLEPIDGISLSPKISEGDQEKMVFYSAVVSFNLYGISTNVLKNEELCKSDQWRKNVTLIGRRQSQSDGMIFNKNGDLYYSLVPLNAVGIWNFREPITSSRILERNKTSIFEPNGFAFDGTQLYLLGNKVISTLNTTFESYLK
ncbi:protein yellow-like [Coccinella septempunctata]|uniref:protein yellow-like n=1 Tax=Coccinella septempunctata TaxID=41139 RepID=UPI001D07D2D0|nr:protein yellow-like [Coccinella septempunctata]